jgi:hypothetical protein
MKDSLTNWISHFYISKNEPCPCGSGKDYGSCCLNNKDKIRSKLPTEYYSVKLLGESLYRCCLHPDKANCDSAIKNAHALQNHRILSKLSIDGHVWMLNFKKNPIIINYSKSDIDIIFEIDKVSVNQATTSTCFCNRHDDLVFADIEKPGCDFDPGNDKQKFIFAYKAFIFEYYRHLIAIKTFQKQVKEIPSSLKKNEIISYYREIQQKLVEMEYYKCFFDNGIMNTDYRGLETAVVEIPYEIKFANFACISPEYDLNGKKVALIDKKSGRMKRVFLTIFPAESKSYIILSYLCEDRASFTEYKNQLLNKDQQIVKLYFNYMLPLYSENIVLSPRLWNAWDEDIKMAFTVLINSKGRQLEVFKKACSFSLHNLTKSRTNGYIGKSSKIDMFT